MKFSTLSSVAFATAVSAQNAPYAQCGGIGFSGSTTCSSGYTCKFTNEYYSQCVPGTGGSNPPSNTMTTSTTKAPTSTSSPGGSGRAQYMGVNIAGFDFGVTTDGSQTVNNVVPPILGQGGPDGVGQMQHFIKDDGMNIFRLPVGWQYLVGSNPGGTIISANLAKYDLLVQGCLNTGATCIIDIHNYARFNGAIIGQGGPTDAQFANLWTQLATKYKGNSKLIFGLMNEPHDVDINRWAQTVQVVVTAIRNAGATSQMLLLPGNEWTSASGFVPNGSAAALSKVKNPDGSTTGLIFDVHKYLDSDNSGTHAECVMDNISNAFQPLATWLRANKRQAMLTESGGGNVASCVNYFCKQNAFINANSDVYLGVVGWSAGSFDQTYVLTMTPTWSGNSFQDTLLVKSCLKR
ncbi:hypothetical protein VTL71DRAFT_12686 [Oculimacula yallundae]|uniref:cellulase n=1 Tax=Oculimacula yallundae TaxID=86028 RepID=A0ABR4CQ06_9HELO